MKFIPLFKICEVKKGSKITKAKVTGGSFPVISGGQKPVYYHGESKRKVKQKQKQTKQKYFQQ